MTLVEDVQQSYLDNWRAWEQRVAAGTQPSAPFTSVQFLIWANVFYLGFTFSFYAYMKRREEPFKCKSFKSILLAYNASCVFAAGYVVWGIFATHQMSPFKFVCNPTVIPGSKEDLGHVHFSAHVFWIFYAQKFWEFLDTWFFIARKSFRQVTFLHVFHHCSINIVVGLLLPFDFSGDMYLPILLNAFVHVLMYGHYLVAALGLPTPWKPWLTSIQLTQFITIATQSGLSLSRGDSCGAPYFGKVLMVTYMGSMLILFGNFFYHSYILKKPTARFGDGVIKKLEPLQVTTTHTGRSLLDEAGNANVELPSAFASGDLSYQVTPIGGPMPQLHVASEPSEEKCSFALAGGSGGRSVSWTVTKVMTIAGEAPPKPPPSCCGNPQEQAGTKKTK